MFNRLSKNGIKSHSCWEKSCFRTSYRTGFQEFYPLSHGRKSKSRLPLLRLKSPLHLIPKIILLLMDLSNCFVSYRLCFPALFITFRLRLHHSFGTKIVSSSVPLSVNLVFAMRLASRQSEYHISYQKLMVFCSTLTLFPVLLSLDIHWLLVNGVMLYVYLANLAPKKVHFNS